MYSLPRRAHVTPPPSSTLTNRRRPTRRRDSVCLPHRDPSQSLVGARVQIDGVGSRLDQTIDVELRSRGVGCLVRFDVPPKERTHRGEIPVRTRSSPIVPSSRSVSRPTAFAFSARFRRSASVKMMRRSPSRSRSRRFSASRYSITDACCRCSQPATTISRNCRRAVDAAIKINVGCTDRTASTVTTQPLGPRSLDEFRNNTGFHRRTKNDSQQQVIGRDRRPARS